jgi:transcriptional regulator with XRE-family HTH domain
MAETVLGTKLKKLRKEKKITQNKLSEKLGLSPRYIAKVEVGMANPSMEIFKKLADFFQVPVEYLVSENEDPNTLSAIIRNKDVLEAFVEVDQMNNEDQKTILQVIRAFATKNKMKVLLDGKNN